MAYEVKPNTGSLFKNDKKETESHPDYTGSGLIDGTEYWFSSWINTAKDGSKYMSLKFKPKDAQQVGSAARQQPQRSTFESAADEADIPF